MSLPTFRSPHPRVQDVVVSFPRPHVLLVTLNRPKQLNAIPSAQHYGLERLYDWFDGEPSLRCAVVTGAGRAFCAGADLKEWNQRNHAASAASAATRAESSMRWPPSGFGGLSNRRGKKPIIAAVNGLCLGGGMEMAINTDLVVAAEDAKFGLPEVTIGVVAVAGALPRLVRTVGLKRASEMALTGRTFSAAAMKEWGVVNAVVPTSRVLDEALRLAEDIAANSPDSIIVTRQGLRLGWEAIGPHEGTLELGEGMYAKIDAGENMREGVESFVKKRRPTWKDSKL